MDDRFDAILRTRNYHRNYHSTPEKHIIEDGDSPITVKACEDDYSTADQGSYIVDHQQSQQIMMVNVVPGQQIPSETYPVTNGGIN